MNGKVVRKKVILETKGDDADAAFEWRRHNRETCPTVRYYMLREFRASKSRLDLFLVSVFFLFFFNSSVLTIFTIFYVVCIEHKEISKALVKHGNGVHEANSGAAGAVPVRSGRAL